MRTFVTQALITVKKHTCIVYLKSHFSHGTWSQHGNLDDLTQKIGFSQNLLSSNKYIMKKDTKIQSIYQKRDAKLRLIMYFDQVPREKWLI